MKLTINGINLGRIFSHHFDADDKKLTIDGIDSTKFSNILNISIGDYCDITVVSKGKPKKFRGKCASVVIPNNMNYIGFVFNPCALIEAITNIASKKGAVCRICQEENPYATPIFDDGTFICYRCSERIRCFSE